MAYFVQMNSLIYQMKILTHATFFRNYVAFNFHQTNIKKGFINYIQNKIVQLSNNPIVK